MNDLIERMEAQADMQGPEADLLREGFLKIMYLREALATWRLLALVSGSYGAGYIAYDIWKIL